jgi:tRNA threonylcarbamoyl adenosine modification protein (Sua5/YciO/YrdC/YwlC family)
LQGGGLVIYPTDTVYGLGCDIFNTKAVEKVARIKGIKVKDADFSFICHDFSHLSDYTRPIGSSYFKLLSKNLPGPLLLSCLQATMFLNSLKAKRKQSEYVSPTTLSYLKL